MYGTAPTPPTTARPIIPEGGLSEAMQQRHDAFIDSITNGPHPLEANLVYPNWFWRHSAEESDSSSADSNTVASVPPGALASFRVRRAFPLVIPPPRTLFRHLARDFQTYDETSSHRAQWLYAAGRYTHAAAVADGVVYAMLTAPAQKRAGSQYMQFALDVLSRTVLRQGRPFVAAPMLLTVLERDPTDPDALLMLAETLMSQPALISAAASASAPAPASAAASAGVDAVSSAESAEAAKNNSGAPKQTTSGVNAGALEDESDGQDDCADATEEGCLDAFGDVSTAHDSRDPLGSLLTVGSLLSGVNVRHPQVWERVSGILSTVILDIFKTTAAQTVHVPPMASATGSCVDAESKTNSCTEVPASASIETRLTFLQAAYKSCVPHHITTTCTNESATDVMRNAGLVEATASALTFATTAEVVAAARDQYTATASALADSLANKKPDAATAAATEHYRDDSVAIPVLLPLAETAAVAQAAKLAEMSLPVPFFGPMPQGSEWTYNPVVLASATSLTASSAVSSIADGCAQISQFTQTPADVATATDAELATVSSFDSTRIALAQSLYTAYLGGRDQSQAASAATELPPATAQLVGDLLTATCITMMRAIGFAVATVMPATTVTAETNAVTMNTLLDLVAKGELLLNESASSKTGHTRGQNSSCSSVSDCDHVAGDCEHAAAHALTRCPEVFGDCVWGSAAILKNSAVIRAVPNTIDICSSDTNTVAMVLASAARARPLVLALLAHHRSCVDPLSQLIRSRHPPTARPNATAGSSKTGDATATAKSEAGPETEAAEGDAKPESAESTTGAFMDPDASAVSAAAKPAGGLVTVTTAGATAESVLISSAARTPLLMLWRRVAAGLWTIRGELTAPTVTPAEQLTVTDCDSALGGSAVAADARRTETWATGLKGAYVAALTRLTKSPSKCANSKSMGHLNPYMFHALPRSLRYLVSELLSCGAVPPVGSNAHKPPPRGTVAATGVAFSAAAAVAAAAAASAAPSPAASNTNARSVNTAVVGAGAVPILPAMANGLAPIPGLTLAAAPLRIASSQQLNVVSAASQNGFVVAPAFLSFFSEQWHFLALSTMSLPKIRSDIWVMAAMSSASSNDPAGTTNTGDMSASKNSADAADDDEETAVFTTVARPVEDAREGNGDDEVGEDGMPLRNRAKPMNPRML